MKTALLIAMVSLIAGYFAVVGAVMLARPDLYSRFLIWQNRADKWSEPASSSTKPGLGFRIAGLLLAIGSVAFMLGAIARLLDIGPKQEALPKVPATPDSSASWFPLALALFLALGGVYVLLKPMALVRWTLARPPFPRVLNENKIVVASRWARLFGIVMLAAALSAFHGWLANR